MDRPKAEQGELKQQTLSFSPSPLLRSLSAVHSNHVVGIQGLRLLRGFISAKEHDALVAFINKQPWSTQLSRSVQQYGFVYDYAAPSRVPAIPTAFAFVLKALVARGIFPRQPDQSIVNLYQPGQGIVAHVDNVDHFGGIVASLSMSSAWVMEFSQRPKPGCSPAANAQVHKVLLPAC